MRLPSIIFGFAAALVAHSAWAAPVALAQITYSDQFRETLQDNLGAYEGEVLRAALERYVSNALIRHGATIDQSATVIIEITIVDARPNHPTMQQIVDRPGLDPHLSISTGGAELRARVRTNDGTVLREVSHRRYSNGLIDIVRAQSTWTEARRAMQQFAEKVADAYEAQAPR